MFERGRKYCFYTESELFIDAALYYVYTKENELLLNILLNSTFFGLLKEILARPPEGGGGGPIQMKVYQYEDMPIISITEFQGKDKQNKIFNKFINREIKPIFEELGIDPDKPIREQEPKPLPDRAELDKIIFDELGLTEQERKEVYWAVCELVKQRIEKARSLRE